MDVPWNLSVSGHRAWARFLSKRPIRINGQTQSAGEGQQATLSTRRCCSFLGFKLASQRVARIETSEGILSKTADSLTAVRELTSLNRS